MATAPPTKFQQRRRNRMARISKPIEKMSARNAPFIVFRLLKVLRPPGTTELGAVVVTVSVVVPLPVTLPATQVLSDGNPEHENVVAPLNPFEPVTVSVIIADWPGLVTVIADGEAETAKSGCRPTFTVIADDVDG